MRFFFRTKEIKVLKEGISRMGVERGALELSIFTRKNSNIPTSTSHTGSPDIPISRSPQNNLFLWKLLSNQEEEEEEEEQKGK